MIKTLDVGFGLELLLRKANEDNIEILRPYVNMIGVIYGIHVSNEVNIEINRALLSRNFENFAEKISDILEQVDCIG